MEDETTASAPNETHPLLPVGADSPSESTGSGNGSSETAIQDAPSNNPNPTNEEDATDDCCRQTTPPCADGVVVNSEPKSGGEYKAIIDMLKDAERCANDPEYEEKVHARRFGAIKYNPRNQESKFTLVDYCCAVFQCCAVCIEG